jgi:8-oxo-dGTP diphosphatase
VTGPAGSREKNRPVEVAAAVIQRPDGAFLLAQRPQGKVYAGYWEFPGGKAEPGEPPAQALARELHEELGIDVETAYPWITRVFTYPHATVRLRFYRVLGWKNEPQPREEQAIAWQRPGSELVSPMLPANAPVLASLALPAQYAITDSARFGTRLMLDKLEQAMARGLRLVQLREPRLSPEERRGFHDAVIGKARRYGCKVMVKELTPGADGIHFTAAHLKTLENRPEGMLAAASCHTREELERAMQLELDFAVVGPVKRTTTHPQAAGMGWEAFAELIGGTTIPVYAIGGLARGDLEPAWRAGAHGVAMIRGAWS